MDSVPPPKRTTGKRARRQPEPPEQDSDEEPIVPSKRAKTAPAKKQALETIPEESDNEEDVPLRLVVRSRVSARKVEEGVSQWHGSWVLSMMSDHLCRTNAKGEAGEVEG